MTTQLLDRIDGETKECEAELSSAVDAIWDCIGKQLRQMGATDVAVEQAVRDVRGAW